MKRKLRKRFTMFPVRGTSHLDVTLMRRHRISWKVCHGCVVIYVDPEHKDYGGENLRMCWLLTLFITATIFLAILEDWLYVIGLRL